MVATFDLIRAPDARDWLAEQALDDDGDCVVRRLIVREGRSRAFVNGRPASGSQLKELGDLLVDIHGQHAHQSLLRPNDQRTLLDAYGGHGDLALTVVSRLPVLPGPGPAAQGPRGGLRRAGPAPGPAALPGGGAGGPEPQHLGAGDPGPGAASARQPGAASIGRRPGAGPAGGIRARHRGPARRRGLGDRGAQRHRRAPRGVPRADRRGRHSRPGGRRRPASLPGGAGP